MNTASNDQRTLAFLAFPTFRPPPIGPGSTLSIKRSSPAVLEIFCSMVGPLAPPPPLPPYFYFLIISATLLNQCCALKVCIAEVPRFKTATVALLA